MSQPGDARLAFFNSNRDIPVAVLDGTLETLFRKRYPDFRAANGPIPISLAA